MPRDTYAKRKRIEFDGEIWHALHQLSLDSMRSFQELADEAFRSMPHPRLAAIGVATMAAGINSSRTTPRFLAEEVQAPDRRRSP